MALNDNSKERIKFACKELEEALGNFETGDAGGLHTNIEDASTSRHEKIHEIKRQLQNIRQQLDSLS